MKPDDSVEFDEEAERACSALFEAIASGSIAEIESALANPKLRSPTEAAPLEASVLNGTMDALKFFLARGSTMTEEQEFLLCGNSAIQVCVEEGRLDMLELLLKQADAGAFLNAFDAHGLGWNPLIEAAKFGKVEIVKCLLAAGADVNAHDDSHIGETALAEAVMERHAEVVRLLLKARANPDIPGWMWNSARDRAAESTPEIRAMIKKVPFRPTDHPRYAKTPKSEA